MENELLNASYELVHELGTIQAMERGENGWREATIDKGLVRCTSPIQGDVRRVTCYGGELKKYLGVAVTIRILGGKLGRVFVDQEGRMMIVTTMSDEAFKQVPVQIAEDVLDLAGYND